MPPIRNIGNLPPEFRRTERNQKQAQLEKAAEEKTQPKNVAEQGSTKPQDQVNLSSSALSLLQREAEIQKYAAEIPSLQTISEEQKQEIQAKIQSGFYANPEVAQTIADKIAENTDTAKQPQPPANMDVARYREVLENIRSGKYDASEVVDVISERILKDL